MSQENVEAFRRGIDAWNRGDLEAWLEGADPDSEWHPSAAVIEGRAYRGHEGFRRFWADIEASFDDLAASFTEIRDLGDAVLGLGRLCGRSKQGVPVNQEYGLLIRYRDGLAVCGRSWFSHAEALRAAGRSL
jgi:ketosteroid isomerase-like protein